MKKRLLCALMAAVILFGIVAAVPPARAASELTVSQELVDMLKKFEGFLKYPVWDNRQYSMGYGTYCSPDEYEYYKEHGITEEEAEERLRYYANRFGTVVNNFCNKHGITMTQQQFDAMVCLSYNCGDAWVRETDGVLYNALASGATGAQLLYAFSLWSKSSSYNTKGLIERRMAEGNLYLNGVYGTKMPDNYSYVLFDANGGMVNYSVQGYCKDEPATILVEPAESITGTNSKGETDTYTFDGWYTAISGGSKVELLDGSLPAGTTLYAHWKDSKGNVVTPPEPDVENIGAVTVTVTSSEVNVRQGPGTGYAKVGVADLGKKLVITHLSVDKNGEKWGKFADEQWICLRYTDYGTSSQPKPEDPDKPSGGEKPSVTGIVNVSDFLNIRSGPGTGYDVVGTYPGGERVTILEQKSEGADVWGRTDKGWISMAYVQLDAAGETVPPTTKPVATVPPMTPPPTTKPATTVPPTTAAPPTTKPVTTVPPTTTAPPTTKPVTTVPPTTAPYQSWQGTVQVSDSLCIRSGAGTYHSIKGYLVNGDVVTILEEKTVDGMRWGRIDRGWISLKYVVEGGAPETQPPTTQAPTTQPPTTLPPTTAPYRSWEGTVQVSDKLFIRSGPGTDKEIKDFLKNGAKVTILEEKTVDGVRWGRIEKGWISLAYVKDDSQQETVPPTTVPPTTQLPTTVPTEPTGPAPEELAGKWAGQVSAKNLLYLRTQPGAAGKILGNLTAGTRVTITRIRKVDGKIWGKVDKGWICMDFVEMESADPIATPANTVTQSVTTVLDEPITMTVNSCSLRVRKNAGVVSAVTGFLPLGADVRILETKTVGTATWGRIDSGWVNMRYLTEV